MDASRCTAEFAAEVSVESIGSVHGYETWCAAAGLKPDEGPYGLVLGTTEHGDRVTLLTDDVNYMAMVLQAVAASQITEGIELASERFVVRDGWPCDWPVPETGHGR
ncbi:hypothetical protein [Actinomadura macrotermitis]|uniref:Uncharacterized protein n=1 Tax=Actinomadura macrotermitis TaxID=2585200 RepID=A0A7K0BSF8_9ACTN|nr:hypothetical protein [Actinomadura macrotermitis]MQY04133.1 hypothetical protein [Actinomadura macrotermitis]